MIGTLGTGKLMVLGTRGVMGMLEIVRGDKGSGCARDRRGDSVAGTMGTGGVMGLLV